VKFKYTSKQRYGMGTRARDSFKKKLLQQSHYTCRYCFGLADQLDHIVPLRVIGLNQYLPENYCVACRTCNTTKGDFFLGVGNNSLASELKPKVIALQNKVLEIYPEIMRYANNISPQKGVATIISLHFLKVKDPKFVFSYFT
jgi:hypothetical protein